ncbi:MAG: hypothetical protein HYW50_02220 [Candidatus Diapherotrites archaeon]|nr:hypothetical protein [Candidatus Diapherotrites archaeon]
MMANVIIDLEPFAVLLFGLNYPLHGFFHSFFGGFFAALFLAAAMVFLNAKIQEIMKLFQLRQPFSASKILFSSVAGVWLHVLFDSTLYTDIKPFFPLKINPFFVGTLEFTLFVYVLCTIIFFAGIAFYLAMIVFYNKK